MRIKPTSRPRKALASIIVLVLLLALASIYAYFRWSQQITYSTKETGETIRKFPDINDSRLSPLQKAIIAQLRTEYEAQPAGTKYSQGITEPWCADFVSWIMREAGRPLENPHSGSWRIPGTVTLREYYQAKGTFQPYGAGYQPKIGDVVLYDTPGFFGQHTNIVIKNENGILTTVGGNERGKIRVFKNEHPEKAAIIGYGVL